MLPAKQQILQMITLGPFASDATTQIPHEAETSGVTISADIDTVTIRAVGASWTSDDNSGDIAIVNPQVFANLYDTSGNYYSTLYLGLGTTDAFPDTSYGLIAVQGGKKLVLTPPLWHGSVAIGKITIGGAAVVNNPSANPHTVTLFVTGIIEVE